MATPARWRTETDLTLLNGGGECEPTPIYDALREYPTADPCRRAYLREVMAGKRGAA